MDIPDVKHQIRLERGRTLRNSGERPFDGIVARLKCILGSLHAASRIGNDDNALDRALRRRDIMARNASLSDARRPCGLTGKHIKHCGLAFLLRTVAPQRNGRRISAHRHGLGSLTVPIDSRANDVAGQGPHQRTLTFGLHRKDGLRLHRRRGLCQTRGQKKESGQG
jgi:hypothetical protein